MVKRKVTKIRKTYTRTFTWWVRPWIYHCYSLDEYYRPEVYTKEIYKEIADDDNPFTDTIEEWRIYAENIKREEIEEAMKRRWKLDEKPSFCHKIEEKEPSTAEEVIEEEEYEAEEEVEEVKVEEVVEKEVPKGILDAIKGYELSAKTLSDTAKVLPIPELKEDFEKRAIELQGKATELREKYGLVGKEI